MSHTADACNLLSNGQRLSDQGKHVHEEHIAPYRAAPHRTTYLEVTFVVLSVLDICLCRAYHGVRIPEAKLENNKNTKHALTNETQTKAPHTQYLGITKCECECSPNRPRSRSGALLRGIGGIISTESAETALPHPMFFNRKQAQLARA